MGGVRARFLRFPTTRLWKLGVLAVGGEFAGLSDQFLFCKPPIGVSVDV